MNNINSYQNYLNYNIPLDDLIEKSNDLKSHDTPAVIVLTAAVDHNASFNLENPNNRSMFELLCTTHFIVSKTILSGDLGKYIQEISKNEINGRPLEYVIIRAHGANNRILFNNVDRKGSLKNPYYHLYSVSEDDFKSVTKSVFFISCLSGTKIVPEISRLNKNITFFGHVGLLDSSDTFFVQNPKNREYELISFDVLNVITRKFKNGIEKEVKNRQWVEPTLQLLAQKGSIVAQNLFKKYSHKISLPLVAQDHDYASEALKGAGKINNLSAIDHLKLYVNENGNSDAKLKLGKYYESHGNFKEAFDLYEATKDNSLEGSFLLGRMLYQGRGCEKNEELGKHYIEKLTNLEDINGLIELSKFQGEGHAIIGEYYEKKGDFQKAFEHYQKSKNLSCSEGSYKLGLFYLNAPRGFSKNEKSAIDHFYEAVVEGHQGAEHEIVQMFVKGLNEADEKEKNIWVVQASALNWDLMIHVFRHEGHEKEAEYLMGKLKNL